MRPLAVIGVILTQSKHRFMTSIVSKLKKFHLEILVSVI